MEVTFLVGWIFANRCIRKPPIFKMLFFLASHLENQKNRSVAVVKPKSSSVQKPAGAFVCGSFPAPQKVAKGH